MSINGAIAINLIPEIAKLNSLNKKYELNERINFSLFITAFIVIPIMIGMFIYSKDIINLLYPNASKGSELLKLSSISIIFCGFTQTMTGILQGIGEINSYLKIISISMVIKLVLNLILIPVNNLLEKGAVISSLIYDIIVFILLYKKMKEKLDLHLDIFNNIIRISLISIISISLSRICMSNFNLPERINTCIEICFVAIIYFILSIVIMKNKILKDNIFKLKFQKVQKG